MSVDPMADAPRNEPIEALFDGEWIEVEWSDSAWDGSPYGTEGWASGGMLILDLEAWRYPGDPEPEPHGCPTHGDDCPGHLHYEAWAEADLAVSWVGLRDEPNVRTTVLHHLPADGKDFRAYQEPMVRFISNESMRANGPAGWLSDKIDAATKAALNDAMVEAGGIRPQRALVGLDPEAAAPRQQLHFGFDLAVDHGLVSWADWEPQPFPWEDARVAAAMRDEVATIIDRQVSVQWEQHDSVYGYLWHRQYTIPHEPPVPELTPPPPCPTTADVRRRWGVTIWEPVAWPGYPQDELLERLNLRWRYGHPPATPDRARRAGVQP